uniref:Dolichyl-diphosphooligosaccharide--protein glycosyltransferase subunit OST2 n=1 Tax=Spongospora subterranea TaxID=70186 RepID=A0A0H5RBA7_9EUKA|eukprot:CRZ11091.1 hypothetical protein [Spongospora subterranea]
MTRGSQSASRRTGSGKSPPSTPLTTVHQPAASLDSIYRHLVQDYWSTTPRRLQLIDAYLVYIVATGLVQALYCFLAGSFPFNSFLAGFLSCVASFVFGVSLRFQTSSPSQFRIDKSRSICDERAFADWVACNVLLHLVILTFIG